MRKVIVTLVMLVMGSALAQAQTEKGRWTVGAQVGNLGYSGSSEPFRSRSFSMSLSPSAGYFVAKNLVIGASVPISYSYGSNDVPNNDRSEFSGFGVGLAPFARYYVGAAKLRLFLSASVDFQQFWLSSTRFGAREAQRSNFNATNYSVGGGAAYFINNTVSLDASLNYTNYLGGSAGLPQGRLGLNIGFRLFFGK